MSSPSPSQLAYGQPTGSSLIPFFVGSPGPQGGGMGAGGGLGGPMGAAMGNPRDPPMQPPPQRADVADMERFQQGSNRIGTPTLAGGGRGQMAVGGSRPIGPHSNSSSNNNNNNTSQQNSNNQRCEPEHLDLLLLV